MSLRNAIFHYLRHECKESRFVQGAFLFGSILNPCRRRDDVDLIVFLRVKHVRRQLTIMRKKFRYEFGLRLHVQLFWYQDIGAILRFLTEYGPAMRLC